jgi:hypothetical protein
LQLRAHPGNSVFFEYQRGIVYQACILLHCIGGAGGELADIA